MADYRKVARRKAEKYGLDPNVFERQINAESGFRTNLTSTAGATGIAQFMPATARGLGINPNDPEQALDAAAKLMSGYVKKYGSYEKALRAYNAGPAAIERSRGFGETNAYVKKILTSGEPGKLGSPKKESRSASGSSSSAAKPSLRTVVESSEEFDEKGFQQASRQVALRSILEKSGSMRMLQGLLPAQVDPAEFTKTVQQERQVRVPGEPVPEKPKAGGAQSAGSAGIPGLKGKGSGIFELFHDPVGGWDNGQNIGAIGGHGGHVHAAAGQKTVVGLGKLAEEMGLTVREHPKWDKVDPVHTQGSHHYKRQAVDVSGDPKAMRRYTERVKKIYGLK